MSDTIASSAPQQARRLPSVNAVYVVLLALLVAIYFENPGFIKPFGYMLFLKRAAPLAILAAGQVYVLVSGGFDLSVGSLITLDAVAASMLLNNNPAAVWWVIPVLFGIGACVGLVNGLIVCFLKVPSLLTTLGMMITLNGIALTWSGGSPRGYLPESFRIFGRFNFTQLPLITLLPLAVIVLVAAGVLLTCLMHRANYGRLLLAVGDNPVAARLAGVPVFSVRIMAFIISALSATVTGILLAGFAGVSTDIGTGYELQAITAAVLGGAQLLGGRGSVPAAIVGALTLQAIFTLLNFLGLPNPLRDVVQGTILIAAVALAMYRRKRAGA